VLTKNRRGIFRPESLASTWEILKLKAQSISAQQKLATPILITPSTAPLLNGNSASIQSDMAVLILLSGLTLIVSDCYHKLQSSLCHKVVTICLYIVADFVNVMSKLNEKFTNSCSIDTGTSLVYCVTPNNLYSQFDKLYVGFSSAGQFTIDPESYVIFTANAGAPGYTAVLRIMVTTTGNYAILGTPFLKDVHMVLDSDARQIGFGQ